MHRAENHRCHQVLPIALDLLSHGERYRISLPPHALLHPVLYLQQHVSRETRATTPVIDGIGVMHPASDRGGYPVTHWHTSTSNKHLYQISVHALSGAEGPV